MTTSKNSPAYRPPVNIKVRGATAPNGEPYVRVAASGRHTWVALSAFSGSGADALGILKANNMPFLKAEWKQCCALVADLKSYPAKPLINCRGFNASYFALPSGEVFPRDAKGKAVVLFPVNKQSCAASGSIETWRQITEKLRDQPLATFVVLVAYAAPFLALTDQLLNQGFELAGPRGVGKSTLQRLAAAVCGPADNPAGVNYWMTAHATVNGLERVMAEHRDMPIILDELNHYAASDANPARARKLSELIFALSNGSEKLRFGGADPQRARFNFVFSTNDPIAQVLAGHHPGVAAAAADRLLTLPIGAERPFGIFDCLPDGFENSGELADYFNRQIRVSYGVGIRELLEGLLRDLARNPKQVIERLRRRMDKFRETVGVDRNDGSATRVADAFGLEYAAARFAISYGAISKRIKPLKAAVTAYKLHEAARSKPVHFAKILRNLADPYEALEVEVGKLTELSDEEIDEAPAIVRIGRDGRRELLLTEAQLMRAFSDRRAFFEDPEIKSLLLSEGGRKQNKRQIRLNRVSERFYVFYLRDDDDAI